MKYQEERPDSRGKKDPFMEEKDFQRIEKMISTVVDSRLEKAEERFD